ncbi:MAG: glycosyltransferase family 2 protein [Kiritimatiellia bacterium]
MTDISIVIPVYDEEENVPLLSEELYKTLSALERSWEVVMVDDGSDDSSWDRITEAAGRYPGFRGIRLRRNYGQTAAMSAGFRESKGNVIITLDADLQNDPGDIPALLEMSDKGVDVVSGWRRARKDPFLTRRLPSMIANRIISRITGVRLHDYGCTLKAYRREIADDLHLYGEMHRFLPALASWVGAKVEEVPVNHHPRKFGSSKYGLSRISRVVLDLMTVKFLMRYSTRPIQIFGKLGMFFGVPGLAIITVVILGHLSYLWFGTEFASGLIKRPFWIITPFMLILFCLQFISIGLLAEIQIRTYHESQSKPIYVIKEQLENQSPR